MELDPAQLPPGAGYRLLIGAIVPRPIALVATVSPDGRTNLAPFSFFNGVSGDPPTLLFCPANKPDGSEKDSLRNAGAPEEGGTGEFVVNVASEPYAAKVAACAEELPYGQSEFDLSGLTPAPSRVVRPPRVARAPLAFECRTLRVIRLAPGQPGGGNIVIGRIVHVHAADGLVDDRFHVNADALAAFGRMGGRSYCRTRERFDMPLGRAALSIPDPFTA